MGSWYLQPGKWGYCKLLRATVQIPLKLWTNSFNTAPTSDTIPLKYPECDNTKDQLKGQPYEGNHQDNQLHSQSVDEIRQQD